VNWFSVIETTSKGKRVYINSWVSNVKPSRKNIEELVEVGRHRWQIENQAFDVLKNHGYNLEHNFGHRNAEYLLLRFFSFEIATRR